MTTQERRWLGSATPADGALIPTTTVARIVLVLVIGAGIYFFHDFLVPVLAALVIGFASWPLYRRVLARFDGNRPLAATFAILLVLAFIVVPVVMAVSYMIGEVDVWYDWVVTTNRLGSPTPEWLLVLPGVGPWLDEQWVRHIGHPGAISELVQLLSGENIASISRTVLAAGRGLFDLLLAMLFMLIALFFIYKDGENFMVQVDRLGEQIFPLRWQRISRVVPATISSSSSALPTGWPACPRQ
jgi:predicted PurR-regulated permease PerM